jgi:hypothetical protein
MELTQYERAQLLADLLDSSDERDRGDLISWVESGYVRARFGDVPVFITPELAAQIKAFHGKRS